MVNSGELTYCPICKTNRPTKDFLDQSLKSGIGRTCMQCKGKPKRRKNKKTSRASTTRLTPSDKSCRVCSVALTQGVNWAPSRVKRHDYICGSCHGRRKKGSSNKKSSNLSSAAPPCPKCGTVLIKRYSFKYSKEFWGCPKYPRCKGGRNING